MSKYLTAAQAAAVLQLPLEKFSFLVSKRILRPSRSKVKGVPVWTELVIGRAPSTECLLNSYDELKALATTKRFRTEDALKRRKAKLKADRERVQRVKQCERMRIRAASLSQAFAEEREEAGAGEKAQEVFTAFLNNQKRAG